MTWVLVLCCRPTYLSPGTAEEWLRTEVAVLLAESVVVQIQITTLLSASSTWGRAWDYLITIDLRDGASASAAISAGACADLLGDLRQLGMQPHVIVATDERTVVLRGPRS